MILKILTFLSCYFFETNFPLVLKNLLLFSGLLNNFATFFYIFMLLFSKNPSVSLAAWPFSSIFCIKNIENFNLSTNNTFFAHNSQLSNKKIIFLAKKFVPCISRLLNIQIFLTVKRAKTHFSCF
jgi:hypothetical protein